MTRDYIDSQVTDRDLADDIEKCYQRWLERYYPLFVEGK
jgi:hypothetical protein